MIITAIIIKIMKTIINDENVLINLTEIIILTLNNNSSGSSDDNNTNGDNHTHD